MNIKWHIMLICFVVSLVIFGGMFIIIEEQFIQSPIQDEIMEIDGVKNVSYENNRNNAKIIIDLDYVSNFNATHAQIVDILKMQGIYEESTLIIEDNRNEKLEELAYYIKPALYEGAREGNYIELQDYILECTSNYEINNNRFFVNESYINVQAKDGNSYLYISIPIGQKEGDDNSVH